MKALAGRTYCYDGLGASAGEQLLDPTKNSTGSLGMLREEAVVSLSGWVDTREKTLIEVHQYEVDVREVREAAWL